MTNLTHEQIKRDAPEGAVKYSTYFAPQGIPVYYFNDKNQLWHSAETWVDLVHPYDDFILDHTIDL